MIVTEELMPYSHLDAIAHVLSFKHHTTNRFHPFIPTRNGICRQSDRLLVCPQPDALVIYSLASDSVAKVDHTMREIWIL